MLLSIDNKLYHFVRSLRPRQWIKNVFVFAPAIFSGSFFVHNVLEKSIYGFVLFSMVSSSIYLINDCIDADKDKLHPIKKNRPIASGKLSKIEAYLASAMLLVISLFLSYERIGKYFAIILVSYFILQVLYSIWLKHMIIIDALVITFGFILRVYAGALAIPLSVSSWLILAVLGVSLLLAFGKRRAERSLLAGHNVSQEKTRAILKFYPDNLLDSMISVSASFAIISYSLFSFQVSPESKFGLIESVVPSTLVGVKLLMLTIPVVVYGVARYLFVIYKEGKGESPERVLLSDKPLFLSGVLWAVMVLLIMS